MEEYLAMAETSEKTAGDFLKDFPGILDVQKKYFAKYIGMKPSNLSKELKDERPVNNDLALIFARLFNHDPMLWIKIQAKNESYSPGELLRKQEAAYSSRNKKGNSLSTI